MSDQVDLLENIYSNSSDFKIKISEIRRTLGAETLKSISEDFGVGISVIIAKYIFGIQESTIHKIRDNGLRPDWEQL